MYPFLFSLPWRQLCRSSRFIDRSECCLHCRSSDSLSVGLLRLRKKKKKKPEEEEEEKKKKPKRRNGVCVYTQLDRPFIVPGAALCQFKPFHM